MQSPTPKQYILYHEYLSIKEAVKKKYLSHNDFPITSFSQRLPNYVSLIKSFSQRLSHTVAFTYSSTQRSPHNVTLYE